MKPLDHFYDNPINQGKGTPRVFDCFFAGLIRVVFTPAFRLKVSGAEALCALDEGLILAGNHRSYLDPLFVMQALRPRSIRFIGKEEFFRIPAVRRAAAWAGVYPIKRGAADIKTVKRSVAMLKRGELVGIFPEGTRGRGEDIVEGQREIHEGVALIANLAHAKVVPFKLWNTEKISPEGSRRWHFPTIELSFGTPLSLDDPAYDGLEKAERLARFSADLMEAVYRLARPGHESGQQ